MGYLKMHFDQLKMAYDSGEMALLTLRQNAMLADEKETLGRMFLDSEGLREVFQEQHVYVTDALLHRCVVSMDSLLH
jgi:hypothetical protein